MKVKCGNYRCNWIGDSSETLKAPNPFNPNDELSACPKCKEMGVIQPACDEPGCGQFASFGTPTPSGYRWVCHEHAPRGIDP
jgi:hypothetical protein